MPNKKIVDFLASRWVLVKSKCPCVCSLGAVKAVFCALVTPHTTWGCTTAHLPSFVVWGAEESGVHTTAHARRAGGAGVAGYLRSPKVSHRNRAAPKAPAICCCPLGQDHGKHQARHLASQNAKCNTHKTCRVFCSGIWNCGFQVGVGRHIQVAIGHSAPCLPHVPPAARHVIPLVILVACCAWCRIPRCADHTAHSRGAPRWRHFVLVLPHPKQTLCGSYDTPGYEF